MLPSLDNFVSFGTEVFKSRPDYRQMVLDIYQTSISSDHLGENDAVNGCKLAESILLNLRGVADDVSALPLHTLAFSTNHIIFAVYRHSSLSSRPRCPSWTRRARMLSASRTSMSSLTPSSTTLLRPCTSLSRPAPALHANFSTSGSLRSTSRLACPVCMTRSSVSWHCAHSWR